MKIHIFTVYNSRNFGSYLQAVSLMDVLSDYGEVDFVDTKSRDTHLFQRKELRRNLMHLKFRRALCEYKQTELFIKKQNELPVVQVADIKPDDICVFGSDEIWNIARTSFERYPIFWGCTDQISLNVKFSYAPSINFTTVQQLKKYGAKQYLDNFIAVSVRDEYSRGVLAQISDKTISKTLDPTMLFDKEMYLSKYEKETLLHKNYIAVYCFYSRNDPQVKIIKNVARILNRKLVSVGLYNSWCDFCVCPSGINPFVFYEDADFVISNTFHGVAFAIIFKKHFVAISGNKSNKVKSMLEELNLDSQISDGKSAEKIVEILNKQIDYKQIEDILEIKRQESHSFIRESMNLALNKIGGCHG